MTSQQPDRTTTANQDTDLNDSQAPPETCNTGNHPASLLMGTGTGRSSSISSQALPTLAAVRPRGLYHHRSLPLPRSLVLARDPPAGPFSQQEILSEVAAKPASGLREAHGFEQCTAGSGSKGQERWNEEMSVRQGEIHPLLGPFVMAGYRHNCKFPVSQGQLQVEGDTQPASGLIEGYRLEECRDGVGGIGQEDMNEAKNQRRADILPWAGNKPLGETNSGGRSELESAEVKDHLYHIEDAETSLLERPPSKGEEQCAEDVLSQQVQD